ncbi:class I SAM-dependent methyltransferase [Paraburkholderia sp. RL17-383-BIF-A]|uniref:class I SAM-dependent methyltransferase n=1 Tax=Paraburkholderia sp. RL17-383-BIF-A TaxID=3031631 RepID=UPI0038BA967A
MSAWLEHGPFAFWLMSTLRPSTLVELGTHNGFSYMAWCQAVERLGLPTRCFAVDSWLGDAQAGFYGDEVYLELSQYNDRNYGHFSRLIKSTFYAALAHFPDGSIDLLHIDGQHDYESVRHDFETWLPKMSRRGIVLLHDSNVREQDFGVWRLWDDLSVKYPAFEFLHGHGLGVLAVGDDIPDALRTLCEARGVDAAKIRQAYGRLGRAITLQQSLDDALGKLERKTLALDEARRTLVGKDSELFSKNNELLTERSQLAAAEARVRDSEMEQKRVQAQLADLKEELDEQTVSLREAAERLQRANSEVAALRGSTSWRLTAPVRVVATSLPGPRAAVSTARNLAAIVRDSVKSQGWTTTLRKIAAAPRRHGLRTLLRGGAAGGLLLPVFKLPPAAPALDRLGLRVLIIAETSIPQCLKYRVTQKQQMIQDLGIDCSVVSWNDIQSCRDLLQTHSVAFFYRVPGFPEPLSVIAEAKARGLVTFWEVDDIIFDAEKYIRNSNLRDLNSEAKKGVLSGVPLYRAAMLACDFGIASTTGIADAMLDAGVAKAFVVENALDEETVRVARRINGESRQSDGLVRIAYGSGTKTHDADFRVAAPAIKRVLQARPDVRFRVLGELNLPPDFAEVSGQIERLPLSNYPTYLKRLSECDISIAPLEDSVFNDAKSNIKYLEASIVRLPSLCSPRAAFRTAIRHGDTGYLPDSLGEWEEVLLAMIDDVGLREAVAQRAYDHVSIDYAPHTIANTQVAPILAPYQRETTKVRVLGVNIYFEPRSFGGATVIAEEMARRLNQGDDIDYFMFTSLPTSDVPAYKLVRYESTAASAFAMGLPHENDPSFGFENPHSLSAFSEVVHAVRPGVVHLHSIQGIGAQIAEICQNEGIPFVVTLHDAWWICGRHFMITGENRYCNQRKIDTNVCASCVSDAGLNTYRQMRLHEILSSAALLIAPSEFSRQLYAENGFDPAKIVVNKNGIRPPSERIQRESLRSRPLRFGYVGGEIPIKGAEVIKKAFKSLRYSNYELRVVDNVLNLGRHSIDTHTWNVPGTLKIVPSYTQATIDNFFNDIDVLLFPTQCKESFGLSVREALIRDVWVISTDAGGAVEDIFPGENGDIIPLDDDGTKLAEAIGALLADPTRLDDFRNPYAGQIRLFDEQAQELGGLLMSVAIRPSEPALAVES